MYINELATEAEKRTNNMEAGEGAVVLVVDDVQLQAASRTKLKELLVTAAWWAERRDTRWSGVECAYLRLPRGQRNELLYLNGSEPRVTES